MATVRVLASVAAFGDEAMVTSIVLNVLQYLSPIRLALHTSKNSAAVAQLTTDGNATWSQRLKPYAERLIPNPVHVNVHHHSAGDVLPIHLLNIELLLRVEGARKTDRIVLMPGNAVLFRPCGPIVGASPMSFFPGTWFSDLWASERTEEWPKAELLNRLPVFGWPNASSAMWREQVGLIASGNDTHLRQVAPWHRNFFGFFSDASVRDRVARALATNRTERTRTAALLKARPLGYMNHEGSWYPSSFLAMALTLLRGTNFDPKRWSEDHGRCPIHNFPLAKQCSTEEHILPSLAWQRAPSLVRASAGTPPLILRAFDHPRPGAAAEVSAFVRAVVHEVSQHDGSPTTYCGLKFVRDRERHDATRHLLHLASKGGLVP